MRARAGARFLGTTPVSELLAWLDEPDQRAGRDHWLSAFRAGALAMLGRFDEARAILAETRTDLAERGAKLELAMITGGQCPSTSNSGRRCRRRCRVRDPSVPQLEELGNRFSSRQRRRGSRETLYELDRLDEADAWATRASDRRGRRRGDADAFRQARAKALARRGENAEAERLAREAVAIGERTDISTSKATPTPTWPRCSYSAAKPTRQQQRSTSASSVTSARATSSWLDGCARLAAAVA